MKVLTIRQPWAWAIFNAGKDIENRDWPTKLRGRVAIHSAKGMTFEEYTEGRDFILNVMRAKNERINMPMAPYMLRGFILGTVEIVDCVSSSGSPWFMGKYGFVLKNARLLNIPIPAKGSLNFWEYAL